MKTRGFIIFALIALLTLCCFSAMAEDFALPVSVTRVEEEAFRGDSALTEVTLREGVTEIGPRAFADCVNLTSIDLPDSLTRIADDAFDGSENVTVVCGLHSAAYAFAREQGLAVRLRGDYAVSSPRTEAGGIYALVAAAEDCELYAEALSEDMTETLFSGAAACAGGEETEVCVPCGELPTYYVLRLTLRDGAGRAISAPCVTRQYTAAYEAFEQLTPADFSGGNVLDYGDAGFAVAKEGVTEIQSASGSDGSYTFTPSGDVQPGDCLIIGGQPVKAASVIRNADGTVTVATDPDIVLADFFDTIHIDMSADMGAAMQQDENAEGRESALTAQAREGRNADESATLMEISTSHTVGPVTASIRFSAKLRYKLIYDAKHFGKDYFETESYVEIKGSARVSAKKDSGSAFSVKLFEGFVPTPIPGMSARVKAELPIKVSGEGSFGFSFTGKYGFRYNPIDGQVPMEGFTMKPDVELKAKAEIKAGIGASLGLRTMGVIGIDLKCEAGAKVSAAKTFLDTPSTKRHACALCFDIDVKKYAEISASLNYEITEWLKGDILKFEIASYEGNIWKGYLSVINDAESVHGGRIVLDEGSCPNYQYLMTVKTYDENNKAVTGIRQRRVGRQLAAGIRLSRRLPGEGRVPENDGQPARRRERRAGNGEPVRGQREGARQGLRYRNDGGRAAGIRIHGTAGRERRPHRDRRQGRIRA